MYCIPEKKEYSLNYLRVEGAGMTSVYVAKTGCKDDQVKLLTFIAHVRLGALSDAYHESRYMFMSDAACSDTLRTNGVPHEQVNKYMRYAKEVSTGLIRSRAIFTGFQLGDCSEFAL